MSAEGMGIDLSAQAAAALSAEMLVFAFDATGALIEANETGRILLQSVGVEPTLSALFPTYAEAIRCLSPNDSGSAAVEGLIVNDHERSMHIQGLLAKLPGPVGRQVFMGTMTPASLQDTALIRHRFDAINAALAICQYSPDGHLIDANPKFFKLTGRSREEILGNRFDTQWTAEERETGDPVTYWESFARGESETVVRRYMPAPNTNVWVREIFVPTFDETGRLLSVLSYAYDITAQHQTAIDNSGRIAAIDRAFAWIEFDLSGRVVTANDNFLTLMGYTLDEIKGAHHRIFCDPDYAQSPAYRQFWQQLGKGELDQGEYKRFRKDGGEVWLQASYNPIFDLDGVPCGVVKLATDVTAQRLAMVEAAGRAAAIDRAQAVVEFDLSGVVLDANANFLEVMGYERDAVVGRHHRTFCDPGYLASPDYADRGSLLRAD